MCSEEAGCNQLCPGYTLILVKTQRFSSDEQEIHESLVMISRKQSWEKIKACARLHSSEYRSVMVTTDTQFKTNNKKITRIVNFFPFPAFCCRLNSN